MNIEATANRILNPIAKNGELLGAGLFLLQPSVVPSIMETVDRVVHGGIHGLELENFVNYLMSGNPNFMPAAMTAILGYIAKDATNNPTVQRLAEIAQKVGTGLAVSTAAYGAAYFMTHSPAPPNMKEWTSVGAHAVGSSGYMNRGLI